MANEVVNSGARASADTTNIDEVISYLESPEYLRMIARQQGESPDSLLSGSRSQPWQSVAPEPAPEPAPAPATTTTTLTPLRLHLGGVARIVRDYPWSAPLHPGDRVTLISDEYETNDDEPIKWFRVRDEEGTEWSVPSEDMEPITDGLADWEREILETPHPPYDVAPEPEPVPTGATAATFGVDWSNTGSRCQCGTCRARRRPARPVLTERQPVPVPVQMRTRDGWWEFRDTLDRRMPFNTHGALRGRVRPESSESGYLRDKSPAAAQLWQADQSKIDYVVYSYNTPIAWHVTGSTFREWIYPDVRYSRTTSAHQSKIKTALLNTPGGDHTRMIREAE